MAEPKKLPSGNWRVRVYSHTTPDGKKHYESFTASTKQQAQMLATKFQNDNDRRRSEDFTVREAVENYIKANEMILSPATIYGYTNDAKRLECIGNVRIRKITSKDVQGLISNLMAHNYSAKTIRNTYGTLRSALTFAGIDQSFMVHLPSAAKKTKQAPEHEQIAMLYNAASKKMKIAIALAAFHSLRRGEIASLRYGDIKGNELTIHSDMVYGVDKKWHYKDVPKTDASNRTVYLPQQLLDLIGTGFPDEYILGIQPNTIGQNFIKLKKRLGIEGITFHSLRHFFASLAVILQIPDIYCASLGGWRNNSSCLKETYQGNMVSMSQYYAEKISNEYLSMTQKMTQSK